MQNEIKGQPADVTFVLTVTRKDTGIQEHYNMEGFLVNETQQISEGEKQCQQQ